MTWSRGTAGAGELWVHARENRTRFAVEVAEAVADEIGADRTGIRISPANGYNDMVEDDVVRLYDALIDGLSPLGLAYLHVIATCDDPQLRRIRAAWPGVLMLTRGGADPEVRVADLASGLADVVAFGVAALANPDLVARIRDGAPLNAPDRATFYGGGARGYTDYPALAAVR